jgi:hypothetical protein
MVVLFVHKVQSSTVCKVIHELYSYCSKHCPFFEMYVLYTSLWLSLYTHQMVCQDTDTFSLPFICILKIGGGVGGGG